MDILSYKDLQDKEQIFRIHHEGLGMIVDPNDFDLRRAGMGGSDLPDLKQEFNDIPHDRGTLSMARSSDPDSANSQFFICFEQASFLDRQYTVFGKVIEGMDFIDKIKKGEGQNGSVNDPDKIISFKSE